VVEDITERPPVAPLWYPPERWKPGETVAVETLPWFLPRCWGLAVGVLQGENWERREQRWRLSEVSNVRTFEDNTWALVGVFEREGRELRPVTEEAAGPAQVKLEADFGGELRLLGHEGLPEAMAAGEELRLVLHWQAARTPKLDYSLFLHLRDEANRTVAQHDGQPTWYGPQPTTSWTPGQPMRSAHTLHLPDDMLPGKYRLVLGVYNWQTLERLPLLGEEGQPLGDELELGRLRVRAASEARPPSDLCCALAPECCVSLENAPCR